MIAAMVLHRHAIAVGNAAARHDHVVRVVLSGSFKRVQSGYSEHARLNEEVRITHVRTYVSACHEDTRRHGSSTGLP